MWLAAVAIVAGLMTAGSVSAQATSFSATLSGGAEVPPVTSDFGGNFSATLSGGTLDFTLTSDAMGITQAHIHIGAADANGGVVAFLFPMDADGVDGIDVSGSIGADDVIGAIAGDFDALIAALNAGEAYVNVHSLANPPGEVRGQIAPAAQQIADPEAVVEAFAEAINAGDIDAAVALFAEDGAINLVNNSFVGPAEIRGDLQNQIDNGINFTNVSIEVSGNTATVIQEVRRPAITDFGIDRIIRLATFEILDGKIASLAAMPDTSDADTLAFQMAQMASGGGGGGGGGGAMAMPDSLPSTGSGGLAAGTDDGAWVALSIAGALAAIVMVSGVGARIAIRRRR